MDDFTYNGLCYRKRILSISRPILYSEEKIIFIILGNKHVSPLLQRNTKYLQRLLTIQTALKRSKTKWQPMSIARYTKLWENYKNMSSNRISTIHLFKNIIGVPRWCSGKESTCQCRRQKRYGFDLWVRKIPLVKELTTHASILAWRISGTDEPGGPRSPRSQRVRYDWATGHARMGCI